MEEKEPADQTFHKSGPEILEKDLVIVALWMFVAVLLIYIPVLNQSFLRVIIALPIILFIPGYVLISALFPGKGDLEGIERLALSFGFSIVIVPLIGLVLNYTPWGIKLDIIVVSLFIFTMVMLIIAKYVRSLLLPDERFFIPLHDIFGRIGEDLFTPSQSGMDRTLSILLIIAIVAVITTTIYVIVVPEEDEKFTEFYILGPGDKAADYPTRFPVGEKQSLIVGIGNHEYQNITYTVETILLVMTFNPVTGRSSIIDYQPLDTFTATLSPNEIRQFHYNFTVNEQRFNRLQFLLYNGTIPSSGVTGQERINASYKELHLWFTVSPGIMS